MSWPVLGRYGGVFFGILLVGWIATRAAVPVVRRNPGLRQGAGFHSLFFLFFVASCLDTHSTFLLISRWGIELEANFIPFLVYKELGIIPGTVFRLVVVNAFLYFLFRKTPEGLVGMMFFYPLVPLWNYYRFFALQ